MKTYTDRERNLQRKSGTQIRDKGQGLSDFFFWWWWVQRICWNFIKFEEEEEEEDKD